MAASPRRVFQIKANIWSAFFPKQNFFLPFDFQKDYQSYYLLVLDSLSIYNTSLLSCWLERFFLLMFITRRWRILVTELSANKRTCTHTLTHKQIHINAITHLNLHVSTHMHTQTRNTYTQTRPTQFNTSPSFSAATVNVKQQNLNVANENIGSCVILYCTSY